MRVFITGATGLVGTRLVQRLRQRNDEVVILTRRAAFARERFDSACTVVEGDPVQSGPWMDSIGDSDAVVHLAGENVFGRRWNADFKTLLHDSRVKSTENVVKALSQSPHTSAGVAKVLVNASAIGYYGAHGDEELTEDSPPGNDALACVCIAWENAARAVERSGVRLAIIRIGVVLDREGGALKKMLTPFKMFVGGPVGSGKQYVSWIHHEDLVGLFLLALDRIEIRGPMNGTAPNPVTNKEFSKALGRALHRPSFMRTPRFMLRVMLGEVAGLITTGQRVVPRKALEAGYSFKFPDIDGALQDVLSAPGLSQSPQ
jgi:uncharacterized protein (TIGR01777 family)